MSSHLKEPLSSSRLLVILLAIPVVLMGRQLPRALWFDESYTIGTYASQSVRHIVTDYSEPNNHIGYSLLIHPITELTQLPFLFRLVSLLSGLGTLVLTFLLVDRAINRQAAGCSLLILGTNQVFLNFAVQVRGYSLSMFLVTWLAYLSVTRQTFSWRSRSTWLIAFGGGWLVYVIPTNILFLVTIAFAEGIFLLRSEGLRHCLKSLAAYVGAVLIAIILYSPVLSQMQEHANHAEFSLERLLHAGQELYVSVGRDVGLAIAILAIPGCLWSLRKRSASQDSSAPSWHLLSLSLGMLFVPFGLSAVLQVSPFPRNFLPIIPFLAILAGWGLSRTMTWLATIRPSLAHKVIPAVFSLLLLAQLGFVLTFPQRLLQYRMAGKPENLYTHYTSASFDPDTVAELVDPRQSGQSLYYACVMSLRAWQNLGSSFAKDQLPVQHFKFVNRNPTVDTIYIITMSPPDFAGLSEQSGFPREILEKAKFEGVKGGFLISTLPGPIPLPKQALE